MGARTKARKRALDILFESDLRGLPLGATLQARRADPDRPLNDYTIRLVEGVAEHQADLDATIERYSTGWSLRRMPAVDRNLLRIGVYELTYVDDVPDPVALSEAVSLARELSTEESPAFVNGVLASVAAHPPAGAPPRRLPAPLPPTGAPPPPTRQRRPESDGVSSPR